MCGILGIATPAAEATTDGRRRARWILDHRGPEAARVRAVPHRAIARACSGTRACGSST